MKLLSEIEPRQSHCIGPRTMLGSRSDYKDSGDKCCPKLRLQRFLLQPSQGPQREDILPRLPGRSSQFLPCFTVFSPPPWHLCGVDGGIETRATFFKAKCRSSPHFGQKMN